MWLLAGRLRSGPHDEPIDSKRADCSANMPPFRGGATLDFRFDPDYAYIPVHASTVLTSRCLGCDTK